MGVDVGVLVSVLFVMSVSCGLIDTVLLVSLGVSCSGASPNTGVGVVLVVLGVMSVSCVIVVIALLVCLGVSCSGAPPKTALVFL